MKKVTSSDVARYLGVSRSAVSRAFTEGASIREDKRQEILQAARKLGYQPNLFARNLSTPLAKARSNLVAILINEVSSPYQSLLVEALSATLLKEGKMPMLLNVQQGCDLKAEIMRLSGYQVDGVIAVVGSLPEESLTYCLELSLPLVTLGRSNNKAPSVQTDNRVAGQLAAGYFLDKGLQNLGYLAGRKDGQASIERLKGFKKALSASGINSIEIISAGRYSYDAGFQAGCEYKDKLSQLDGIFCACDALALGLMESCRKSNMIRIPDDLSIVGCDDIAMSGWAGYQLTTVQQPVQSIAGYAVQILEGLCSMGERVTLSHVSLEPKLVVRMT